MDGQNQVTEAFLKPGDILLFDRPGIFSEVIKWKRGEKYSHVEIYLGNGQTVASRNGIGVGKYPIDLEGIAAVYRVNTGITLDFVDADKWFLTVDGQGYDWIGLLSFTWAKFQGRDNGKMFCSEFVMRWFRRAGLELFSPATDADAVSPGLLTYSDKIHPEWLRADKKVIHHEV